MTTLFSTLSFLPGVFYLVSFFFLLCRSMEIYFLILVFLLHFAILIMFSRKKDRILMACKKINLLQLLRKTTVKLWNIFYSARISKKVDSGAVFYYFVVPRICIRLHPFILIVFKLK